MRKLTYVLAVVLVFSLPWEDSISIPTLGSLARMVGLIVSAFWAITIIVEGKFRKFHLFHALVLVFFIWNFISIIWSSDTQNSIQRLKTYAQMFLLILILWEVFQKPEDLMVGLQAYIFGAYVLIASTFYNYAIGNQAVLYESRYSATGVNAVDLALILILGMPMAMQLFFWGSRSNDGLIFKIINLAYIPLAIFATLLSGSRTSLIAVIPFLIYLVSTQQIRLDRKLLIVGILFLSIIAMIPFIPLSIISRLGTLSASIESGDIGGRVELWQKAVAIFAEHPFLGLGAGTLESSIGSVAHNTFISILAETGMIGFGLFAIILGIVFFYTLNIPSGNSSLWVCILITWILGVSSLSWESKKLTWVLLNFIVIEDSFNLEQWVSWKMQAVKSNHNGSKTVRAIEGKYETDSSTN